METTTRLFTSLAAGCMLVACNHNAGQPSGESNAPPPTQTQTQMQQPSAQGSAQAVEASGNEREEPAAMLEDPGAQKPIEVTQAVAVMQPTHGNHVRGTITFRQNPAGGVDVSADVSRLPPGTHAFHVHQFGDCSGEDGKTAGTHFNFEGSSDNPGPNIDRITGNLGELSADKQGHATLTETIKGATLQGRYSIIGRSVIIHAQGNDPKQPPIGAAGARLACGVIGVADASTKTARRGGHPRAHHGG